MNKEQLAKDFAKDKPFALAGEYFLAGFDAAEPKWIKVTPETMPEDSSKVQFYWSKNKDVIAGYFYDQRFRDCEGNCFYIPDVSHYRYLDTTPPTE
jgi:hypothetical protein